MRLETALFAGKESLLTHGTALNTVSDNLANANTVGFKGSRLEFADLVAESLGNLYGGPIETGNGVKAASVSVLHDQQGTIDITGRGLDASIQGKGWFVLNDGTNTFYTRAGNFRTNDTGVLISQNGASVLGYTDASPETPTILNVSDIVGGATPTSLVTIRGNVNAASPNTAVPGVVTYDTLADTSTFNTQVNVIDSIGGSHEAQLFFFKTAPREYSVRVYVDGEEMGAAKGTPVEIAAGTYTTGPNGVQEDGVVNLLAATAAWSNGADAANFNIDISGMTALAGGSALTTLSSDGIPAGSVQGISVNADGNLVASLDSGVEAQLGKLALASFNSPDGLEKVGDNLFTATAASGDANLGSSGKEGLGVIKGSSLESSTVDPAREFVTLIQYQQGYRAGSQVIQTISELISSTIQIA